jgi:hypothetical protein
MITSHTFLDFCWVCNVRFSANVKEERHHIIPRAYGGVDGPQVSLCDSHHSALHAIALRLYSKKPYFDLLTKTPALDTKLMYLASVACNARLVTENDPNKRQVFVWSPGGETLQQLKQLKTVYGRISRDKLLALAIANLHTQHFK